MLKFTSGDMFETPADIRVNTVNCVGVMGAGVALAFKQRYPDMFREYKRECDAHLIRPGKLHVWRTFGDWVINFPTKRDWRDKSRYEDIESGLVALRDYLLKVGPVKVALPALGCGHGGLDWTKVSRMIQDHLEGIEAEVIVFDPADSRKMAKAGAHDRRSRWTVIHDGDEFFPANLARLGIRELSCSEKTSATDWDIDVAVLLSSKPDERETVAATGCVTELARPGLKFSLVMGTAASTKLAVLILEKGGSVIAWVPQGLDRFKAPQVLSSGLAEGRLRLVSVAKEHQSWNPGFATKSSAAAVCLAKASLFVDPAPRWLSALHEEDLVSTGHSPFYLRYQNETPGVACQWQELHARPIGRRGSDGRPNVELILQTVATDHVGAPTPSASGVPANLKSAALPKKPASSQLPSPTMPQTYPKRLIEVDLPIRRISEHARREKSIRHGHISSLHIWWARRPLAACRAVICAALWPDPADPLCPKTFIEMANQEMLAWTSHERQELLSSESRKRFGPARTNSTAFNSHEELRGALLDFIADFANWDNSTVPEFLATSRALTQAAHEALGGAPSTRPLVVDPFAGGGSIPLEALRVGADAFASDLNPVPVLLNKVVLEYIPKYGQRLADEVRRWGEWVKREAEKDLAEFYPKRRVAPDDLQNRPLLLLNVRNDGVTAITVSDIQSVLDSGAEYTHCAPISASQMHGPTAMLFAWGNNWSRMTEDHLAKRLADIKAKPLQLIEETPIVYLWARTIQCEGPGCGVEVPLIRSLWLAKKANRSVALQLESKKDARQVDFKIIVKQRDGWVNQANTDEKVPSPKFDGFVKRGSATCPCCGYTTPVARVREQLKSRRGGAHDARLYCVVSLRSDGQGRFYRIPSARDLIATSLAAVELAKQKQEHTEILSLIPDEATPAQNSHRSVGSARVYGMDTWEDLFSPRQALSLATFGRAIRNARAHLCSTDDTGFGEVMQNLLAFAFDKLADLSNSLCRWEPNAQCPRNLFGRQAIPMVWDFAEGDPMGESSGSWTIHIDGIENALNTLGHNWIQGHVERADATQHPLPDDSANVFFTDPPYYDAVPYAEVSDFFYVWLKRNVPKSAKSLFEDLLTPKTQQAIVWHPDSLEEKAAYEGKMGGAMSEGRRVLNPAGIGIVVFAHKTTAGWEAQLSSMIEAGWIVTASWPVDTECGSRMNAQGTAALASSVHLICRPRENPSGDVRMDEVGDWRDVLQALPSRIHEWMPRLAEEGVVGADAIFACLGPALEVFSRYSRVEKASGEAVTLKEYLEHVWAAVSKEALSVIFEGANTEGFEPDARLTAMWLWTLAGPATEAGDAGSDEEDEPEDEDDGSGKKSKRKSGFSLEYDAARKIAQGLGAHLEDLRHMVEVFGDTARLLQVAERTAYLFGKDQAEAPVAKKKKQAVQPDLFAELAQEGVSEQVWAEKTVSKIGETTLDRIHQSMILFAAGRSEGLKRFLTDDGAGKDAKFWRLAQALSALYPPKCEEKRWVDGVLARKKGLGL